MLPASLILRRPLPLRPIVDQFQQVGRRHVERPADLLQRSERRVVVVSAADVVERPFGDPGHFGKYLIRHALTGPALVRLHRLSKPDRNHTVLCGLKKDTWQSTFCLTEPRTCGTLSSGTKSVPAHDSGVHRWASSVLH